MARPIRGRVSSAARRPAGAPGRTVRRHPWRARCPPSPAAPGGTVEPTVLGLARACDRPRRPPLHPGWPELDQPGADYDTAWQGPDGFYAIVGLLFGPAAILLFVGLLAL